MITILAPHGCLGCNWKENELYLKVQGIPRSEIHEVDRRQPGGVECDDCGRAWLRVRPPVRSFEEHVGPT